MPNLLVILKQKAANSWIVFLHGFDLSGSDFTFTFFFHFYTISGILD
jgi:hypothetical protein